MNGNTAILAIRLAALYAWFQSLGYFASGLMGYFIIQSQSDRGGSAVSWLGYALPGVILIFVGVWLFARAPQIAHRFLPVEEAEKPTAPVSAPALAFAVVGLAAFLYALPHVISTCVTLMRGQGFQRGEASAAFLRVLPQLAAWTIEVILGFALFVRPQKLATWWQRKRQNAPTV